MNPSPRDLTADIKAIDQIPVIPTILEAICKRTGMGFAAVALVTDEKWIACAVLDHISFGLLPGGELELKSTICYEISEHRQIVVIDHVDQDPNYAGHHTPAQYGFQSYISVPIIKKDNTFFGTLCAIDPNPNRLNNDEVINMFTLYADLISFHLSSVEQIKFAEAQLQEEKHIADLRDNFIAILGHDLRNPLGAISNSAQLLLRQPLDERSRKLASIIKDSSFRMNGLIENVLDFARGKLGVGISLNRQQETNLAQTLQHIVAELQLIWPDRIIDLQMSLEETVYCDATRVAQLFSNLLGNALSHSPVDSNVKVSAISGNESFTLRVSNHGAPLDQFTQSRLFQPFFSGNESSSKKGLGLGLYIASEIAKAHQGSLTAENRDQQIHFTFRMSWNDGALKAL